MFQRTFERQTDGYLILYRVAKPLGYSINIVDIFNKNGFIESTAVEMSHDTYNELENLWDKLWQTTRIGHAVWGADIGAPHALLDEIIANQPDKDVSEAEDELYNSSSRVRLRALQECFVSAYERVDGYRPQGNDGPILDNPYRELRNAGVEPIQPEAMGIMIHQAIRELTSA
jgi:hypothetical protein